MRRIVGVGRRVIRGGFYAAFGVWVRKRKKKNVLYDTMMHSGFCYVTPLLLETVV